MTHGQDYGQQDPREQWPRQYGQSGPWQQEGQGGPWQPRQYDPSAHQQRLGQPPQQPYPPQGQPWAQPGYQAPQGPPGWQQPGYGPQLPWGPQQYGPGQNQRGLQQPPAQYSSQGYGQMQAYALPQPPRPGSPPYAQPQYVLPPVASKSTAAGLILGLLWPGVGCMYAGRVGIGILLMGIWLISIPLVFVIGLGFITGFAAWIASAVLGYTMTREWNTARGIVSLLGPVSMRPTLPSALAVGAVIAVAACRGGGTAATAQSLAQRIPGCGSVVVKTPPVMAEQDVTCPMPDGEQFEVVTFASSADEGQWIADGGYPSQPDPAYLGCCAEGNGWAAAVDATGPQGPTTWTRW